MRISELVRALIDQTLEDVHTALPARVEKFDPTTLRGEVVPLVKRRLGVNGDPVPLPPIVDVPFWMPKAGPFVLRLPVAKGDVVLLVFAERAMERLLLDGTPQDPGRSRRHALDDAIAIPGLLHQTEGVLPGEHGGDVLLLHRQTGVKIVFRADGTVSVENPNVSSRWEMASDGTTTFTTPPHVVELRPGGAAVIMTPLLLLGSDEADQGIPLGDQLKEWLDNHVHSLPDGVSGPPTEPSPAPSQKVMVE